MAQYCTINKKSSCLSEVAVAVAMTVSMTVVTAMVSVAVAMAVAMSVATIAVAMAVAVPGLSQDAANKGKRKNSLCEKEKLDFSIRWI